ncbi:MAG TPA: tetratricopeptide repeat protein [Steroidobacteraceae bacterium]|nr:tetratricopeptide repeat protein [Steroidobacteraceae bacterium]
MMTYLDIKLREAVALHAQGRAREAAALYAEILQSQPDNPDALHLFGVTETQLGRPQAGLEWISKSLGVNPNQPAAIANMGNSLLALRRPADALRCYEEASSAWPEYALAAFGRGNALAALRKPAEALASYDRALSLSPGLIEALVARGHALVKLSRFEEALSSFDGALERVPCAATAHLGRATALLALKSPGEALRAVDRAVELAPGLAQAFVTRGDILTEDGRLDEALAAYDRALELDTGLAAAWFGRGLAASLDARFATAAESFGRCATLDPDHAYARGACMHAQLQICEWRHYRESVAEICAAVERGAVVDFPFSFLAVCDSPSLQKRCAEQFSRLQYTGQRPLWRGEHYGHTRLRIGYISSDFLEHPTSFLMAGVFENHDRRRFEPIAISLREDTSSPTGRRVRAAFERFIVPAAGSDLALASLIRELEIDIAIDLMGCTGEHRAAVFCYRPAPIHVNYLGFPATSGSDYIDYILADRFLIPEIHRSDYSERIVHLPDCFQANDDRRIVGAAPSRAEAGLPAPGLVWCSFHSSYKLNPPLFDVWMRILRATRGSVLWLVGGKPEVERNLRREAAGRGVDPERLVFARPLPYAEHLARLSLADVCLDTLPFNGGTTTSDALWAGVPVVTCAGRSFAARMSGSLLRTLGAPELITESIADYERLSLELALDPARLAMIRGTIGRQRAASPIFDTRRFTRHLEAAYLAMAARVGEAPRSRDEGSAPPIEVPRIDSAS